MATRFTQRATYFLVVALTWTIAVLATDDAASSARRPLHTGPTSSIHFGVHQSPTQVDSSHGAPGISNRARTGTVGPIGANPSSSVAHSAVKVTTPPHGAVQHLDANGDIDRGESHTPRRNEITAGVPGTVGPLASSTSDVSRTQRPETDSLSSVVHSVLKVTTRPRGTARPLHNKGDTDREPHLLGRNEITTGIPGTVGPLSSSTSATSQMHRPEGTSSQRDGDTVAPESTGSYTKGDGTDGAADVISTANTEVANEVSYPREIRRRTYKANDTPANSAAPPADHDTTINDAASPKRSSVIGTPAPTPAPITTNIATVDGDSGDNGALGLGLPPDIENTIRHLVPDELIPWAPWWWWLALSGVVIMACCIGCVCKCTRARKRRRAVDERKISAQLAEEAAGHRRYPSNYPLDAEARPQGLNFYHYDEEPGCEDYEDSYPDTNYDDYQNSWSEFDHKPDQDGRRYSPTDSRTRTPYTAPYTPRSQYAPRSPRGV